MSLVLGVSAIAALTAFAAFAYVALPRIAVRTSNATMRNFRIAEIALILTWPRSRGGSETEYVLFLTRKTCNL
jgi:hypothetical protein